MARDLMTATRIIDAARDAGHPALRFDDPRDLPAANEVRVAFVDWGDSADGWGPALSAWRASADRAPRLVVFGPHADLAGHASARAAGIGPVIARSKLFAALRAYLA